MEGNRTPAWWATRFLLTVGIVSIVISGLVLYLTPPPFHSEAIWVGPLLIWSYPGLPDAALLIELVGLLWMIRISRGPRDHPPRWRYRGR